MARFGLRDLVTGRMPAPRPSEEGDRVTNVELFFDLVYVFAFTQVSGLMSEGHPHSALAVAQGLGVLGTIWWSWTSYAWLANQSHAERGMIRAAVVAATGLMFIVSLAIPQSFHHRDGDVVAPTVFVVGITLVTLLHATVYWIAAREDRDLRRQIVRSLSFTSIPVIVLLAIGAAVGGTAQALLWLAAPIVEGVIVYATSYRGDWRINSLAHFSERHALVVMLALGESVVAIGAGVAAGRNDTATESAPLTWQILLGATISVALALAMWWCYFDRYAALIEHRLAGKRGADRVTSITDTFTYLHLPLIAGVIVAALGIELAMHEVSSAHPLGAFAAIALGGGLSLYLATTAVIWVRVYGRFSIVRFLMAAVALASVPMLGVLPSLAGLPVLTVVVVVLIVVERAFGPRAHIRGIQVRRTDSPADA